MKKLGDRFGLTDAPFRRPCQVVGGKKRNEPEKREAREKKEVKEKECSQVPQALPLGH